MSGALPSFGDRDACVVRRIVSGIDRLPHTVSRLQMDADRFDALSRALITPGSRRAALSALLGLSLPGSSLDAFAAGKGKGKTQHGHAGAKHDHGGRRAGAEGRRAHHRQDRHKPHTQDATDEQTSQRAETTQLASGEVSASDVSATTCLVPGAKGCPRTACCATGCKKKKKKCLPCPAGTEYCASQAACVAPGQCAVSCATGFADCNGDGNCETNTTNSNQHCGGCNKPCGTDQTCVNSVCTDSKTCDPCSGGRVCNPSTGFCACPDDKPTLCGVQCTDPRSDKNHCWPTIDSCGFACPAGEGNQCCNGTCAFLPGCLAGSNMTDCQKQHCGTCGSPCTAEGFACCNGSCVPNNDENCGRCGNNCTAQGLKCVGNNCE
jgi:hypothetical protein